MSITSEAPLVRLGWFLRQARGWTERSQAEIAERVAMLLGDYVALEQGRRLPRPEQLVLLGEVLGVDHRCLLAMAHDAGLRRPQAAAATAGAVTGLVQATRSRPEDTHMKLCLSLLPEGKEVSTMQRKKKAKKETGLKRMNINLDSELHDQFKASVAVQRKKMTDVLIAFIKGYVEKYFPRELKKGGR